MAKTISTTITMPADLRARLEADAAKQTRSLSQQIVHLLTEAVARGEAKASEAA